MHVHVQQGLWCHEHDLAQSISDGGGRERGSEGAANGLRRLRIRLLFILTYPTAGRKIAPNTGANATKFFTLATKSWKLVAKFATRISNHALPRDLVIVEDLLR